MPALFLKRFLRVFFVSGAVLICSGAYSVVYAKSNERESKLNALTEAYYKKLKAEFIQHPFAVGYCELENQTSAEGALIPSVMTLFTGLLSNEWKSFSGPSSAAAGSAAQVVALKRGTDGKLYSEVIKLGSPRLAQTLNFLKVGNGAAGVFFSFQLGQEIGSELNQLDTQTGSNVSKRIQSMQAPFFNAYYGVPNADAAIRIIAKNRALIQFSNEIRMKKRLKTH